MNIYPIGVLAAQMPMTVITPDVDDETAMRSMRMFGEFNGSAMGLVSFSGETGWECHPDGDELLYYLEGEAELYLITATGDVRYAARAGDIVRIPKGLWHSQRTVHPVRLFFVTPTTGMAHSIERPRSTGGE